MKMFQGHEVFPNYLKQQVHLGSRNLVCRFLIHLICVIKNTSINDKSFRKITEIVGITNMTHPYFHEGSSHRAPSNQFGAHQGSQSIFHFPSMAFHLLWFSCYEIVGRLIDACLW